MASDKGSGSGEKRYYYLLAWAGYYLRDGGHYCSCTRVTYRRRRCWLCAAAAAAHAETMRLNSLRAPREREKIVLFRL